jgi:glycosyltransferase involved in cell wall biosynthesis
MPRFSVIIPAFNSEATLSRAVESVLAQTYTDYEVIVVNDGSTDATAALIERLRKDSEIKAVSQDNAGVSAARNAGASIAQGEWLIFLDADDELEMDALKFFFEAIDKCPDEKVWLAGYKRIYVRSSKIVKSLPSFEKKMSTLSGTFAIRVDFFRSLDGYDPRFSFGENSELFRRIKDRGIKPSTLDFISLIYSDRSVGGSKNLRNMEASTRLLLKKHKLYFEKALYEKRVYLQIIGVCNLRLGNYRQARLDLWEAYQIDITKILTLGRFVVSSIPILARKLYPITDYK